MEGMREAFATAERIAHRIDNRIECTAPVVARIRDDGPEELVFASADVLVPEDLDRMKFRDEFYPRIVARLRREDLSRLALGVGVLESTD